MQENTIMIKAIQGSLDNIQYTVEDMKLIANHVHKIPREQNVKLQHITLLTKHILSICNFILSISTTEENDDISIPNIVENIITCCREIENITNNTKELLSYDDSLKLIYNINNILQLRNRIHTMILLGKYISQDKYGNLDDGQETLRVNKNNNEVNENETFSKYVINKNLSDSLHLKNITTIRNNDVCTINDYISYLFHVILPKYIYCTLQNRNTKTNTTKINNKQTNIKSLENSIDKTNMSIQMRKRYSFLFQKFKIVLQSNINSGAHKKHKIYNEETQHTKSSDTLYNTLDYNDSLNIVSLINEQITTSTSSIELLNPTLAFVEQNGSIVLNNVETSTIRPFDITTPSQDDYASNTEYSSTTVDYDGTKHSYDEQYSSSLLNHDQTVLPLFNIEETSTTSEVYSNTDSYYDYTTARSSYDEISTTDTFNQNEEDTTQPHDHVEITTELDKYQLSQNIYTIAQDISNKANEMSSVTSEISSKISDINNLISDINTDEDVIREKVQTLNKYTQELSSKTSEISSLSSEVSRLSSDMSSASQDIPSSEKVQSHRITPWQKITQKAQDLITATQSMVTASQEIVTKSQEITTLSENLKPENAIANLVYDINSRVQGIITEALDIVTAVIEVLTLVE